MPTLLRTEFWLTSRRQRVALLLSFALFYSLVSLGNQVTFRTGALDMG